VYKAHACIVYVYVHMHVDVFTPLPSYSYCHSHIMSIRHLLLPNSLSSNLTGTFLSIIHIMLMASAHTPPTPGPASGRDLWQQRRRQHCPRTTHRLRHPGDARCHLPGCVRCWFQRSNWRHQQLGVRQPAGLSAHLKVESGRSGWRGGHPSWCYPRGDTSDSSRLRDS
jgi:hypothetical protein